eukprot:TRINITY_DN1846_c0_g1_i3.p1 TRINITY_DN1846_c0_g1~~TRINITY_DN1846_c0_g1_i3.p1  ORF type:complete len:273 (-),score=28.02 TRINITY_DN1846_c0_g1_i3:193-1011(-)
MEALFMPYDHLASRPLDGTAEPMGRLLDQINARHLNSSCVVGSGGSAVGYLAHGTATDWMYDALHVPMAFTFEIYGDADAHHDDCFRMFNPITPAKFEDVISKWTDAFVSLLLHVPESLRSISFRLLPHHHWSVTEPIGDHPPVLASLPSSTIKRRPWFSVFEHRQSASSTRPLLTGTNRKLRRTDLPSDVPLNGNAHLKRREALTLGSSSSSTRRAQGMDYPDLFFLLSCIIFSLGVLGTMFSYCFLWGHWQRWKWRWQKALMGRKKESHV